MNILTFWRLIDKSRRACADSPQDQPDKLAELLRQFPADEIVAFDKIFFKHFIDSYTWQLWGAAFVIAGGCSDDAFDYFRGWLIGKGQKAFEQGLQSPDALGRFIKITDEECECQVEGFESSALNAWCELTGLDDAQFPPHGFKFPATPSGAQWEEPSLAQYYPKLAKRFEFE